MGVHKGTESPFGKRGTEGLKTGVGMTTAGFAWLYPLRFAGDGGNHRGLPLQEGAGTCPCRGLGGVPQFNSSPKIEDPPQEEWGLGG